MKYRKKPVTIEAYQTDVEIDIPTLEGTMHANVGDYIITGVRGEQYPCKPDIFIETYEPADDNDAATLGEVPCLPHFWTHDGTLHIELPRLPESISVRLPDQRDREVGSARVWQYTQGSGTCRNIAPTYLDFLCSECGFVHYHSDENDSGDGNEWHYCPNCGAKVADTGACQTDTDGLDCGHVRNSSAYEAGYRDGSVHYELDHCPACKNIADLQEALAENAKLRELLKRYHRLATGTDELWSWQSVYAELRELGVEVG